MSVHFVKFQGGLGNQLFQLAYLLHLKKSFNGSHRFIISNASFTNSLFFSFSIATNRRFMLTDLISKSDFYLSYSFAAYVFFYILSFLPFFSLRVSDLSPFPPITQSIRPLLTFHSGYWHDSKYLSHSTLLLIRDFIFSRSRPLNSYLNSAPTSLAIHYRQGDYLTDPTVRESLGLLSLAYYQKAISSAISSFSFSSIFVAVDGDPSNLLTMINSLHLSHNINIIILNSSEFSEFDTMKILSSCHSVVLSNSSFSYWSCAISPLSQYRYVPFPWYRNHFLAFPGLTNTISIPADFCD